jgi:hypothetical protein
MGEIMDEEAFIQRETPEISQILPAGLVFAMLCVIQANTYGDWWIFTSISFVFFLMGLVPRNPHGGFFVAGFLGLTVLCLMKCGVLPQSIFLALLVLLAISGTYRRILMWTRERKQKKN